MLQYHPTYRMKTSIFSEILIKGIATDTFLGELNYHVYRKIVDKVDPSGLEKAEQTLFNYIKFNAIENSVLSIARVYDPESKKYKTRCIDELLKNSADTSISCPIDIFPEKWEEFQLKYQPIFVKMGVDTIDPTSFYGHFTSFYKDFKNSDSSYSNLKNWRDKILAHNEPYDSSELNIDFKEFEFLILIPKSLIEYASLFLDTGISMFDGKSDSYFIDNLINTYVG